MSDEQASMLAAWFDRVRAEGEVQRRKEDPLWVDPSELTRRVMAMEAKEATRQVDAEDPEPVESEFLRLSEAPLSRLAFEARYPDKSWSYVGAASRRGWDVFVRYLENDDYEGVERARSEYSDAIDGCFLAWDQLMRATQLRWHEAVQVVRWEFGKRKLGDVSLAECAYIIREQNVVAWHNLMIARRDSWRGVVVRLGVSMDGSKVYGTTGPRAAHSMFSDKANDGPWSQLTDIRIEQWTEVATYVMSGIRAGRL